MNAQQPQEIPPNLPVTVTLTVQQWRIVLDQLSNGPHRVVDPLIKDIDRQAGQAIADTLRLNGEVPDGREMRQ